MPNWTLIPFLWPKTWSHYFRLKTLYSTILVSFKFKVSYVVHDFRTILEPIFTFPVSFQSIHDFGSNGEKYRCRFHSRPFQLRHGPIFVIHLYLRSSLGYRLGGHRFRTIIYCLNRCLFFFSLAVIDEFFFYYNLINIGQLLVLFYPNLLRLNVLKVRSNSLAFLRLHLTLMRSQSHAILCFLLSPLQLEGIRPFLSLLIRFEWSRMASTFIGCFLDTRLSSHSHIRNCHFALFPLI